MPLKIKRLRSGGLITNYFCPSRCAHCLYVCGPNRPRDYISYQDALASLRIIKKRGCSSVHIGGGEPLVNPEGLARVLAAAQEAGVAVEYVETNSSWFAGMEEGVELLTRLRGLGMNTLLVSISPFHVGSIPFKQVKGVLAACARAGVGVFPWVREFLPDIEPLDPERTHGLDEFEELYGQDYLRRLPGRYWVHLGGRAAITFAQVLGTEPLANILNRAAPCRELADTSHFHVDLYGNYIPGLCAGLQFPQKYLGKPVPGETHPVLERLYSQGVAGFLDWAQSDAGFRPQESYLNKCHLCMDIRGHLMATGWETPDLGPRGFYEGLARGNASSS